jgi:GDP-L-fucose synthase
MTIIFGSSGMLGKALCEISTDIICPNSSELDLMNYENVQKYIAKIKPDKVVNVSALVAGILANREQPYEFYHKNISMSLNVLTACIKNEVEYLLTCSSTCAYPDKASKYPMTEEDIFDYLPSMDNLGYGMAKRDIILAIALANKQYGLGYGVIIPSNLYGPNDRHFGSASAHFITNLIYKILNSDNEVVVGGSGKPLRQFTYVKDVAKAIKLMLDRKDNEVLNCATSENLSILQLAQKTIEANNLNKRIVLNSEFPDGQFRKDVSSKKLMSKYDFKFTIFEEGIKETYEWYKHKLG